MGKHQTQEGKDRRRARENLYEDRARDHRCGARGRSRPGEQLQAGDADCEGEGEQRPERQHRALKKAGDSKEDNEEITYEGYGPSGVAVIVETLTDNRNRTAGDLRHYFDKCGGNLGQNGSVSFLFEKKGVIVIDNEEGKYDEEKVMDDCFECGAADYDYSSDDVIEIYTEPNDVAKVAGALEQMGYTYDSAEVEYIPMTKVKIDDEELAQKMEKLLDMFDDNDDVQNVYHNWDQPEEPDED